LDEVGEEQLLDLELFDRDGEEEQLDFAQDELHSLLLEENGLKHDEDGEDTEELREDELSDGELEE